MWVDRATTTTTSSSDDSRVHKKEEVARPEARSCSAVPTTTTTKKVVWAVRHGESEWNVRRRKYNEPEDRYTELLYTPDCSITAQGIHQSRQAGEALTDALSATIQQQQHQQQQPPLLQVVSPLRRALETAQ